MKKIILILLLLITAPAVHAEVGYTDADNKRIYAPRAGELKISISETEGAAVSAVYSGGRLIGTDICEDLSKNRMNVLTLDSENDVVKTFIFEGLQSMKPLKSPYIFDKNTNSVTTYYAPESAAKSELFGVSASGEEIFCEDYKDISYARFSLKGSAELEISSSEEISEFDISPHSRNITAEAEKNKLKFNIDEGQRLIVTINGEKKLFIFADKPETDVPDRSAENVFLLTDYDGIVSDGSAVITEAFQAAIDDVSGKGGVLYVQSGIYKTGTLKMRSNVSMYLESGALIQGTEEKSDYPYPLTTANGNQTLVSALIFFDAARDARIYGRGTIDGSGKVVRAAGRNAWLIGMAECENVRMDDVVLRDPAAFNTHIQYSDNVTIDGVKLINDIENPNTDGFDPDSSRNVTIKNCFAYCSDDTVSVKTHRYSTLVRNSYNIIVRDNVFWTKKSAMKVGDETSSHKIHDVLFENNDIIRADRAMTLYVYDGAEVSNISFVNNRAEFVGGDSLRRHLDFRIATRDESSNSPGKIKNVLIKDFYAESFAENYSTMQGLDSGHNISGVYIDNYVVGGVKRNSTAEAHINAKAYADDAIFAAAPEFEKVSEGPAEYDGVSAFIQSGDNITVEAEHFLRHDYHELPQKREYNAYSDMSGVQGENSWLYRYAPPGKYALSDYVEYGLYSGGSWIDESNDFIYGRIRMNGAGTDLSSGSMGDSALTFKAPASGDIKISVLGGVIKELSSTDVNRLRIYKNEEQIFPQKGEWLTLKKDETYNFSPIEMYVSAGDEIIFRTNKGSQTPGNTDGFKNDGDKMSLVPIITYLEKSARWELVSEKLGAVGEKAMLACSPNCFDFGIETDESPRLDYKIYFSEAGTYYLWTRTYAARDRRNTIHAGLDGTRAEELNSLACAGGAVGWFWNNTNKANTYAKITISEPGEHIISFWLGTDGLFFDRFTLLKAEDGTEPVKYMSAGKKGMGFPESVNLRKEKYE